VDAVVVGAGIVGLSSALRLQAAGWRVRVLAEHGPNESTSHLAAAIWFPTRVGPPDLVVDWGERTYRVFAQQAEQGVPGVLMRESLIVYREPPDVPWWASAVGGVRPAEVSELPRGYRYGQRFVVPLVEMPRYLPWLAAEFEAAGGRWDRRRIGSLDEAVDGAELVLNCSGLGARLLAGDPTVIPVRGQIVRVGNPGLTMSIRDEHHPGGRAYVHPRTTDCVLGGTLEENVWDEEPSPVTARRILERCVDLVPALREASVLEHIVGLRPVRPTVRLEADQTGAGSARLIHNYGHGGAGVTLCWGCADDVVRLAAESARHGSGGPRR
jgi:D-amino-acid oxidase